MSPESPDYRGMTTNERLFAAGLLPQWDDAVKSRDKERMLSLLMRVDIAAAGANSIADLVLANPRRYGL